MKKNSLIILIIIFTSLKSFSQKSVLDSLRNELTNGNQDALISLAPFLNSKKIVPDFLGSHYLTNQERFIAQRLINENCYFVNEKFIVDSNLNSTNFINFLQTNEIEFNEGIGYFVLKNYLWKVSECTIRKADKEEIKNVKDVFANKNYPYCFTESGADWSYKLKNPQCLLLLAEYFVKQRTKWNIYNFNENDYINSFKYLTHLEFAVKNASGVKDFIYHFADEEKRLNLFQYFYYHYIDYKWDEKEQCFINVKEIASTKDIEAVLFEKLKSKNDNEAKKAFATLAEMDVERVTRYASEYEKDDLGKNYSLPIFPYRFLKQMVVLTKYCRDHNIIYKAETTISNQLNKIITNLSFKERYTLENEIVKLLKIKDITSVEYFGLINESNFSSTYSIGRILDIWYSKNWKSIVNDSSQLNLYLKKATLFNNLGIIGTCNKYSRKFIIDTNKILKKIKEWDGEKSYSIENLTKSYKKIKAKNFKADDEKNEIVRLFGKISYHQIGEALTLLQADRKIGIYDKYHFLESDFGLLLNNLNENTINNVLQDFLTLSEVNFYNKNLTINVGLKIIDKKGNYDFNRIYEILKFDVVDAFVGGGGGRRDNNVYLVIKLLEIKFKTTLGFINKKCNSQGIWGCTCEDRAKYWMNFLVKNKYVDIKIDEPISISFND